MTSKWLVDYSALIPALRSFRVTWWTCRCLVAWKCTKNKTPIAVETDSFVASCLTVDGGSGWLVNTTMTHSCLKCWVYYWSSCLECNSGINNLISSLRKKTWWTSSNLFSQVNLMSLWLKVVESKPVCQTQSVGLLFCTKHSDQTKKQSLQRNNPIHPYHPYPFFDFL